MSTTTATETLVCDVSVSEPPPLRDGLLPNGESKPFSSISAR